MSDDLRFRNRYRIPSARLASWDYRWTGVYHVTICTLGRVCWFGEITGGQMTPSREGDVVAREWSVIPQIGPDVLLDEWIVMPDHLHGILTFKHRPKPEPREEEASQLPLSLGEVIAQFKSGTTKTIRWDLKRPRFAWQERFHDTDPPRARRPRARPRVHPNRPRALEGQIKTAD